MRPPTSMTRSIAASYRPLLHSPGFRRLSLGDLVSSLGDGMSAVAIAWLALELAPEGSEGPAVAAAVAAYTLPGVVCGLAIGKLFARVRPVRLIVLDSVVRGAALVAVVGLAGPAHFRSRRS
jgi:MFS family permease